MTPFICRDEQSISFSCAIDCLRCMSGIRTIVLVWRSLKTGPLRVSLTRIQRESYDNTTDIRMPSRVFVRSGAPRLKDIKSQCSTARLQLTLELSVLFLPLQHAKTRVPQEHSRQYSAQPRWFAHSAGHDGRRPLPAAVSFFAAGPLDQVPDLPSALLGVRACPSDKVVFFLFLPETSIALQGNNPPRTLLQNPRPIQHGKENRQKDNNNPILDFVAYGDQPTDTQAEYICRGHSR